MEQKILEAIAVSVASGAAAWFAGLKTGRAEFITAVNKAAEQVIEQLRKECDRVEHARNLMQNQHDHCQEELKKLREEWAEYVKRTPPAIYDLSASRHPKNGQDTQAR